MVNDIKTQIKETKTLNLEKEALNYAASFLISAFIFTLLLILVAFGYLLASKNSSKKLSGKIAEVDSQLTALKNLDEEVMAFSSAVSNIQAALDQKQKWSTLFRELNALTPKDIVYTNFQADEAGKARLDGFTKSLSQVAKLMVSLKQGGKFKTVSLNSATAAPDKIIFSLTLELSSLEEAK